MRLGTYTPHEMEMVTKVDKGESPMRLGLKMKANLGPSLNNLPKKVFLEDGAASSQAGGTPGGPGHGRRLDDSFDIEQIEFENLIIASGTPGSTPTELQNKANEVLTNKLTFGQVVPVTDAHSP